MKPKFPSGLQGSRSFTAHRSESLATISTSSRAPARMLLARGQGLPGAYERMRTKLTLGWSPRSAGGRPMTRNEVKRRSALLLPPLNKSQSQIEFVAFCFQLSDKNLFIRRTFVKSTESSPGFSHHFSAMPNRFHIFLSLEGIWKCSSSGRRGTR